jgi:hypothetical protein
MRTVMMAVFPAAAAQTAGDAWTGGIADDAASDRADRTEDNGARADAKRAVKQPIFCLNGPGDERLAESQSEDERFSGHFPNP